MKPPPAEPNAELIKACPYRGLVPYFEDDADYFFGRQSDTRIIVANCMTTRVTLFYGASGVGKSSVLYAGVIRDLRRRALANLERRNCPECVGVAFSSWRDDPVAGLLERVEATLRASLPADWLPKLPPRGETLADSLRAWTDFMRSDLVLLLDQFEEYFLYRDAHDTSFADQLVAVINDPELRVNVLISIREDALARLDTLKANIPELFSNGLRLDHLTVESARLAIEGPLKLYNARLPDGGSPVAIEPGLTEELLSQVQAGRVRLRQTGMGAVRFGSGIIDAKARVEAPYLQMVMMRLWRENIARGGDTLRLGTLRTLGGAEQILRTHLDVVMDGLPAPEQALAARVFHQLVTPSGTKIAHYVSDLAEFAQAPLPAVAHMCALLEDWKARVLRDVTPPGMESKRYEIFHDLLAAPILDWRQRRVAADEALATRKKWVRRIVGAFGVCALMAGSVIVWLWLTRVRLEKEKQDAFTSLKDAATELSVQQMNFSVQMEVASKQLNAPEVKALSQAAAMNEIARKEPAKDGGRPSVANGGDSKLSVLPAAALEGAAEFSTDKINTSHQRDVWNADYSPLPDPAPVGARPAYLVTAGRDKTAFVMDLNGDGDFWLGGHSGEVNAALINPNPAMHASGWFAATASDDRTARVWRFADNTFEELTAHTAQLTGLAWSRSGRWLVTTSKDTKAIIWDVGGDQPRAAQVLDGATGSVWAPTLLETANGSWLVTPSGDGNAYIYSFPDGKLLQTLNHGASIRRAAMSPDGRLVVTAGADGRAVLWDWKGETPALRPILEAVHEKAVRDVAFDATGRHFATGSADGSAQVWDVKDWQAKPPKFTPVAALKGHSAPVFAIAFTPGGPGLVTTSWDRTARIWNFAEKRCLALLTGHANVIWSVKFSPTGGNFCTTSADGTTRIWDLKAIPGTESLRPR